MLQLCNTVYRTDEDEDNSRSERILEPDEPPLLPQLDEARILVSVALTRPVQAKRKFRPQHHEDKQRDDLEYYTSQHDAPPYIALGVIIGCGCKSATGSLKYERDEVACHECDCVGARAKAGDVLAVDDDYAGEAEVESASEEGGADC